MTRAGALPTTILATLPMLLGPTACSDDLSGTARPAEPAERHVSTRPTPRPAATASCLNRVLAAMSTREKAAQLVMTGIRAGGMTRLQHRVLSGQRPGGILLLGSGRSATAVRAVTAAAVAATGRTHGIGPLVAVDQEGGRVQRLSGPGFEPMPSAAVQSGWPESELARRAARWGRALARVGVHVNLAPVADVVPAGIGDRNAPVGALDRGYGSDPDAVGRHVAAVVRGMHTAGVATAVKHFPGLGRVRGNTDFAAGVVDDTTTGSDPLLRSFAAGVAAGTELVMVATATYPRIDPDNRAVFSGTVIRGLLRRDLGFDGVVIADDLGAAAEVADVPPGERAVRFVAAGGDIVVTADAALTATMVTALSARAQRDPGFDLDQHVRRVLALKHRQSTLRCP